MDILEEQLKEMMNVQHESSFPWTTTIVAHKDHSTAHSKIVEVTAGVLSVREGESPQSDPEES